MKSSLAGSVASVATLCVIIGAVGYFVATESPWAAMALLALALLCVLVLHVGYHALRDAVPDIIFGVIDNAFLAVFALWGGVFAGITGAVLGGVVGNTITDGIAGLFEGWFAQRDERSRPQRTIATAAIGKMAGCLLGAGVVLMIAGVSA